MVIEMFPAENGDAFLIKLDEKNILIDMGYSDTYNNCIKNSLVELKKKNQCIDLLIITHIDEDHIEGAIEFLKENGRASDPQIIEVKEIWHNSYRHLQFDVDKVDSINEFEKGQLNDIKLRNSGSVRKKTNESNPVSAKQGSTLAGYLYGLGFVNSKWNSSFNYEAVNLDSKNEIKLSDIKFHILSPDTRKLGELSKLWIKELRKIDNDFEISNEKIFDDAYELYMKKLKPIIDVHENKDVSYSLKKFETLIEEEIKRTDKDASKSNGACIAFILEYRGKKLLFLGDAHDDIISDSLEKYKELGNSLDFDVVKISHHGSIKNNFMWIEKIKSKKYLISTDGKKHGHPNKEVIAKVIQYNNENKIFYFNYPLDISKILDDTILKDKLNYSIVVGDGISSLQVEVNDCDE
ncbi:MBL fold metallo-hydrolase [Clostridium sp.]|uniref:MBL fold metallo-hydrolase n=1 Tax=Clostridium sp. TaxID=1506 RepID=UPI00260A2028|nr:MBL fold metallo-hydrolase [Clostridium sp.]